MIIDTTRFGRIEIEDNRIIIFPRGILGFPLQKEYALLDCENSLYWMQSIQNPALAFAVIDPYLFRPDYKPIFDLRELEEIGLTEKGLTDRNRVGLLVIVNRHGNRLTGNLDGPLVIDMQQRLGKQVVLTSNNYRTTETLARISGNKIEIGR